MKKFIDSNLEFIVTMLGIVIIILILLLGNHFNNIKNKYESDISSLNSQVNQLILDREVHLSELEKLSNKITVLTEENDKYLLQIDELYQKLDTKNKEIKQLNEDLVSKKKKEEEARQLAIQKKKEQEEAKKVVATNSETKTVSRNSSPAGNWMTFEATYYSADCYGCSGITATGVDLRKSIHHNGMRVIAVDPNVIPLGTAVQIKTPNETFNAIAVDVGGAIKGQKVDIAVQSNAIANQLGRHNVQIRIIK